jgi:hypothetical protein
MWLSEKKRFAPNGARIKFLTVVAYKHLAPNGGEDYNLQIQTHLLREL